MIACCKICKRPARSETVATAGEVWIWMGRDVFCVPCWRDQERRIAARLKEDETS